MNVFQSCSDPCDATPFSASQGLYLKPVARLNISVQLPSLKTPGKSISNWEVMEKLRHYAVPEEFISLKVSKSTLEVVRFEGEIENRSKLSAVLARLDGRSIKLSGFPESLRVRAAEAKPDFPTRHSWDSYFRDAKNMNEMKPGERPDTIHITNLPCKWFSAKSDASKPSEYILRKVFEVFGEVRCVDIPMLDPFRSQMKSHICGIKMFSNNQNMIFEAYIQFKEYICFVKAMDALRGMKLLHIDIDGKAFSATIKVDFDKTKHMSDSSIRRRRVERERLMAKEREREEKERQIREEEERKLAAERKLQEEEKEAKAERQRQREERRKAKHLVRLEQREADDMNQKIATEEKLLLVAQRRLESFRLLGELFNRIKISKEKEKIKLTSGNLFRSYRDRKQNQLQDKQTDKLEIKEKELRETLVKKFRHSEQNDGTKFKRGTADQKTKADECDQSDVEHLPFGDNFEENRNYHRGGARGGRGNWNARRRGNFRGNFPVRGNHFPPLPFQPFMNRGGFFPQRGFPRWPNFPHRNRGEENHGFIPPPFVDPYYLDSALNDPYYKYFQKITMGNRRSQSRSHSRSRSYSLSDSRSRSYSRSPSSSRSRSRSRQRRSQSHSRKRSRSSSRRKYRSRRSSKSHRRYSRNRSRSENSKSSDKKETKSENKAEKKDEEVEKTTERLPSVHTWSRSPSRSRSLSWEKRKDEPSSSTTHYKHKVKKRKKEKKKKKKKE